MKHMRVAEARARFGEILDEAERGMEVVVERRGVRFRVVAEQAASTAGAPALFEFVDAAVLQGQWSWKPGSAGVTFSPRTRK